MTQLVRLEGHLRYAGGQDGYDLYLDNEAVNELLDAAMPEAERDLTVSAPWWSESDDVRAWTVIPDEDRQFDANMSRVKPYVPMIGLSADYGRVRITVERLDG